MLIKYLDYLSISTTGRINLFNSLLSIKQPSNYALNNRKNLKNIIWKKGDEKYEKVNTIFISDNYDIYACSM